MVGRPYFAALRFLAPKNDWERIARNTHLPTEAVETVIKDGAAQSRSPLRRHFLLSRRRMWNGGVGRSAFCRRRPQSKPDLISRARSDRVAARATPRQRERERERERERRNRILLRLSLSSCENNILDWSRGLLPSCSRVAEAEAASLLLLFALVTNARHLKRLSSHLSPSSTYVNALARVRP